MPILFRCRKCGKGYRFRDKQAGKTVPCKDCGSDIHIPDRQTGQTPFDQFDESEPESNALSYLKQPGFLIGAGILAVLVLVLIVVQRKPPAPVQIGDRFKSLKQPSRVGQPPDRQTRQSPIGSEPQRNGFGIRQNADPKNVTQPHTANATRPNNADATKPNTADTAKPKKTVPVEAEPEGFPPLQVADWSQIKTLALDQIPAWSATPDGHPESDQQLTTKPFFFGDGELRGVNFSGRDTARLVAVHLTNPDKPFGLSRSDNELPDGKYLLRVFDLTDGSKLKEFELPRKSELCDVSPSGRLAALRTGKHLLRIEIWSLETGTHLYSWKPYQDNPANARMHENQVKSMRLTGLNHSYGVKQVRFLDDEHLITSNNGQQIIVGNVPVIFHVMWKLPECRAVYQMPETTPSFAVSPGRRQVIVPDKNRLHVINSLTGKSLGAVELSPETDIQRIQLGIDSKGSRCCCIFPDTATMFQVVLWDLRNGEVVSQGPVPQKLTRYVSKNIHFCPTDPNLVYLSSGFSGALLDLNRLAAIWSYSVATKQLSDSPDGRLWVIKQNHQLRNRRSGARPWSIKPIEISHPEATRVAEQKLPNGPRKLLDDGFKVSLQVGRTIGTDADFPQRVQQALTEQLRKHGISVGHNPSLVLKTEMIPTRTEDAVYSVSQLRQFGVRTRTLRKIPTGEKIEIQGTHYLLEMSLVNAQGEKVWELNTGCSDLPHGGQLPEGQDAATFLRQNGAASLKKAVEDFFLKNGPPGLLYFQPTTGGHLGFGTTTLDGLTLEVTSLSGLPPGVRGTRIQLPSSDDDQQQQPGNRALAKLTPAEFAQKCREYVAKSYAQLLSDDVSTWQKTLKWCPALNRPLIGLRWGFGARYSGQKPKDAVVMPQPISALLERGVAAVTAGVGLKLMTELIAKSVNFGIWPPPDDVRLTTPVLLGGGTRQELLDGAKSAGLDFIVVSSFSNIKVGNRRDVAMVMQLVEVDTGKQLYRSQRVTSKQLTSPGSQASDDIVVQLMQWVDDNLTLQDVNPDMIRKSIAGRLEVIPSLKLPANPLAIVAELRFYQELGKLTSEQAQTYYTQFLSDEEAKILATGSAAERQQILSSESKNEAPEAP